MHAGSAHLRLSLLLAATALGAAGCPDGGYRTRGDDVARAPDVAPVRPAPADLALDRAPDVAPDASIPPPAHAAVPVRAKAPAPRPAAEPTGPAVAALGKVSVKGDLPRAEVERLLRARVAAFRSCYESELAKSPRLKGRMVLELTVEPTGAVSLADVKTSTLGSSDADMCVGKAARDLHFKSRPGGQPVTVTFPIELHRGG